jgi:cysteine desulfurase
MSPQRCYLDSVAGQAWHQAALSTVAAAADATYSAGNGVYFEAATTRSLLSQAIAGVATVFGVTSDSIIAVHGLGNALKLAVSGVLATQQVSINPISRLGMLQAATAVCPELELCEVDEFGRLEQLKPCDVLITQAGNPEVGTVDDLDRIRLEHPQTLLIVDATEWVGRVSDFPVGDIVIVRASAWAGPASVCFVVAATTLGHKNLPNLDRRQRSMLAPDPVMVLAAATALENIYSSSIDATSHWQAIEYLRSALTALSDVDIHGSVDQRLPHILSFSVLHLDSEALATELDKRGFAVGSGSACLSENGQPSHVLSAMKRLTHGNVRISLPLTFELTDIHRFVDELGAVITQLRKSSGVLNL